VSEHRTNHVAFDFLVLGLTLSTTYILLPIFFRRDVTVSPLVLFGIIFFANISNSFIPDKATDRIFSLRFFARLVICGIFSSFLVLISTIVRSVA